MPVLVSKSWKNSKISFFQNASNAFLLLIWLIWYYYVPDTDLNPLQPPQVSYHLKFCTPIWRTGAKIRKNSVKKKATENSMFLFFPYCINLSHGFFFDKFRFFSGFRPYHTFFVIYWSRIVPRGCYNTF